jgi:iron(III) transport system permease protein
MINSKNTITSENSKWRISTGSIGVIAIWLFLIVFLIYPLLKLFVDAFTGIDGDFTLINLTTFFSKTFYLKCLFNSVLLALIVVITTSVLGFYVAYVNARFEFPGRKLFSFLTVFPIIMPPLVGIMGFVFVLGRMGTVNILLQNYFGFDHSVNFMYGLHGVILAETFHLFPLMMLNISVGLNRIDPSVEEASEIFGITGLRRILRITFPLTTPAYCAGVLLVFTWTFADFATPLVVGIQDLVASQAYLGIVQYVDHTIYRMGIFLAAVMVVFAVIVLVVLNYIVGMKDYTSLSYSRIQRKELSTWAGYLVSASLVTIVTIAFIPYLGLVFAAFGYGWALTSIPEIWTIDNFLSVMVETPKYIKNTFVYASLAAVFCVIIGVPTAWIMARTNITGKKLMDLVITLILAIPGAALGIAYIRAFRFPLPFIHVAFFTIWIIMPLVLAVRRLPFTVKSTHSSLVLVNISYEEAAESVGAKKLRVFKDITLPLIWKGALVGALFSFMTSVQEASSTILLALEGWETLSVGIFEFYIGGTLSEAAALGVVLILLSGVALFIMHRLSGGKEGGGIFG